MPTVNYSTLGTPVQIEGFPKDSPNHPETPFKRTGTEKGAIHLRPGSTLDLTNDELAHIREKYPEVAQHLRETGLTDEERKEAAGKGGPPPDALGENEASRVPRPHDNESAHPNLPTAPPDEEERQRKAAEETEPGRTPHAREGTKLQTPGSEGAGASTPGPRSGTPPRR